MELEKQDMYDTMALQYAKEVTDSDEVPCTCTCTRNAAHHVTVPSPLPSLFLHCRL